MDRLTRLRGEAGGSRDSTLEISASPSEGYMTANDSSKYFSCTEDDSSNDITPIKDVSLASTVESEKSITGNEQLISNLSPIAKKSDLLVGYKFGKQIEAANILSGGVDIFDDNDNSYDGDELVIDDNVEIDDKSNPELKLIENPELPFQKSDDVAESFDSEQTIGSNDTEVVLQIDGKNVNAIDIGNGLYLYRKAGEEELAAVQIVADDHDQPTFKFLKVRENTEGNLEVYEEIEIEVPKEVPTKDDKSDTSHVPIKDINKVISDPVCNKVAERKKQQQEITPVASTSNSDDLNKVVISETKTEINLNGKMVKVNETRKSPVIHSTPNKEGIPLTKTMVDMQLHPSRPLDKVKTIEVHTENIKQKIIDIQAKNKADDNELNASNYEIEKHNVSETQKSENTDVTPVPIKGQMQIIPVKTENELCITSEIKLTSITVGSKETTETKNEDITEDVKDNLFAKNDIESTEKLDILTKQPKTLTEEQNTLVEIADEKLYDKNQKHKSNENVPLNDSAVNRNSKSQINVKEQQQENSNKKDDDYLIHEINSDIVSTGNLKNDQVSESSDKELEARTNSLEINISNKPRIDLNNRLNENTIDASQETGDLQVNIVQSENKVNIPLTTKSDQETDSQNFDQVKQLDRIILKNTAFKEIMQLKPKEPSQAKQLNTEKLSEVERKPSDQKKYTVAMETKQSIEKKCTETVKESCVVNKSEQELVEKQSSMQPTTSKVDTAKKHDETKIATEINKLPAMILMASQEKLEIKSNIPRSTFEKKPIINNNAAVPFGQWTSANRQEFLNKIKEVKIPTHVSNTKSISKPNDLNRRDVLQKIDSQRQSSNAASKNQDLSKLNIKHEAPTFTNKQYVLNNPNTIRECLPPVKVEVQPVKKPVLPNKIEKPDSGHRLQQSSTVTSTHLTKSEGQNRNEFNNQDLIDKTVEGIINRAVSTKHQDSKPKEPIRTQTAFTAKSRESKPSILDAIEMKMNELHGIPFVERPPHELPNVHNRDIKTYSKADNAKLSTSKVSKIPTLLPVTKNQQTDVIDHVIDLDSEEEIIEHEPITGDIDFNKKNITSKVSNTSAETNMAHVGSDSSKKESIITETDFDKFVRRNSITYENCLTVNIEKNKNRNVVQGLVPKDKTDKSTMNEISEINTSLSKQMSVHQNIYPHKLHVTSTLVPVSEDALNKNYHSKLQLAYQTALTTKRQMESPITILEDKPVKVVFMDSNTNFQASQLNVQGQELSPSKKQHAPKELDAITTSTCDSLGSDVLDSIEEIKPQEDTKSNKTKHQRKQVLTPVEAPELELIVPKDLGIEVLPKKKRRTEDLKEDKGTKNIVPKKSYLLGRNRNVENVVLQDSSIAAPQLIAETKNIVVSHKDTASAIDNLVKAAELIENQSGNFKANTDDSTSGTASPVTPVKRGRGRPRKYPLPEGTLDNSKEPSPLKKPRLNDNKDKAPNSSDEDNSDDSEDRIIRENWTMGKINENIVCPICKKLFRSENVVFKHVKHCTGPSPSRSDSDKRSLRRSRLSNDSKSMDSKLDDTDGDTDSVISKNNIPIKQNSKEQSSVVKEDIIIIEDSPVKSKEEKSNEVKQHESRKLTKTKAEYKVSTLSCEHCGKMFRQLSYLVSHKLLHTKANPQKDAQSSDKSVFSCEVCKKVFRKLHHLVQHRIIHKPSDMLRLSRKSSLEQNVNNKPSKDNGIKHTEDQSAAFRCEPCDKSFRKLHHLVEHRETHDGINRQKGNPATQTIEKFVPLLAPPPQCNICKKTFRKLHHLIEHKEQHVETSSEKSDDKSVKSALSTKDIIHECALCYMVFPNEHSLNKHSVFCQKKKRQSKSKQSDESVADETSKIFQGKDNTIVEPILPVINEIVDVGIPEKKVIACSEEPINDKETDDVSSITEENHISKEENFTELLIEPSKYEVKEPDICTIKGVEDVTEVPQEPKNIEKKMEIENITETLKKKTPVKGASTAKRRKSNLHLARIKEAATIESGDEDEVRYMLNPDYIRSIHPDEFTSEGKLFMKIKAQKRNSLQFERSDSKDLVKRRTSLQHPPKVPRLKTKVCDSDILVNPLQSINYSKPAKLEPTPCTDSDDSDVKYSFPKKEQKSSNSGKTPKDKRKLISVKQQKTSKANQTPKEKRKSLTEQRKMLSGIAKRKSLGKSVSAKHKRVSLPLKEIKKRRVEVEHRCDCGELFSSAALLARHTSLAHTPPRVRRRRGESPPAPPPAPAACARKAAGSRQSSGRSDSDSTAPQKAKPGRPPGKATTRMPGVRKSLVSDPTSRPTGLQTRKSAANRGVPVPEKIMEKLKK